MNRLNETSENVKRLTCLECKKTLRSRAKLPFCSSCLPPKLREKIFNKIRNKRFQKSEAYRKSLARYRQSEKYKEWYLKNHPFTTKFKEEVKDE